jgi:hypothetical protein
VTAKHRSIRTTRVAASSSAATLEFGLAARGRQCLSKQRKARSAAKPGMTTGIPRVRFPRRALNARSSGDRIATSLMAA